MVIRENAIMSEMRDAEDQAAGRQSYSEEKVAIQSKVYLEDFIGYGSRFEGKSVDIDFCGTSSYLGLYNVVQTFLGLHY
jgi:hypothetical protein